MEFITSVVRSVSETKKVASFRLCVKMLSYEDIPITYPLLFISACTASWYIKELFLKMSLTHKPANLRRKMRPEDSVRRRAAHVMVSYNNLLFMWGGYMEEPFEDNVSYDLMTPSSTFYHPPEEIYIYDMYYDIWVKKICSGDIPVALSGACAAVHKNFMYLFGGYNSDDESEGNYNNLWRLNLNTLVWNIVQCEGFKPHPCDKASCWVYKNRFYIFGGYGPEPIRIPDTPPVTFSRETSPFYYSEKGWLDQFAYYDIELNKWCWPKLQSPPCPRAAHASAVVGDFAYVFGGRYRARRLGDLHKLDLRTHVWENVRKFPSATMWPPCRSWHTLDAISNDKLVMYGGFSPSCEVYNDIWLFETKTQQWRRIFESYKFSKRIWHTSAEVSSGQLVYVGGIRHNLLNRCARKDHAEDMLVLRFSPPSLTSICLDKVSCDTRINQDAISDLPHYVKKVLQVRKEPKFIHGLF